MGLFTFLTRAQNRRREEFVRHYEWPTGLRPRFAAHHPQLSWYQQERVFRALRDYFQMCQLSGSRMVSMPSQVVDDAWHEFILFTREYDNFCRNGLGRFLHHTPAEAMQTPTQAQDGIKRAWRLACRVENINPYAPQRLPLIFALDGELEIPNGFRYQLNCMAAQKGASGDYCGSHIGCGGGCGGGDSHVTNAGHNGMVNGMRAGDCDNDGGAGCGGSSDSGSSCGGGCGGGGD
jgi:hypothetical protein